MKRWLWLPVLTALLWAGPAAADDLTGILAQAVQLSKDNKPLESVAALRRAITYVWDRMPLTIKEAALVSTKPAQYGRFAPRADNVYPSGEPVLIYVEPVGYTFARDGDNLNFKIACDLNLLSKDGKVLAGQRDFGQWTMACGEPIFEFYMNLTVDVSGVPAGEYGLEIVFRDLNGGSQTSIRKAIVVR